MSTEEFMKKYPIAYAFMRTGIDVLIDIARETDEHYTQCKVTKKSGETWTITVQEITEGENNEN